MIRYANRAQFGRAHLLREYNDVEIFVEDTKCQNMHIRVLSLILEGIAEITSVFPLHGRLAVIEAATKDVDSASRRIYLIDGDSDFLTERTIPGCRRLYRLQAYCIENLLVSASALAEIAFESLPDLTLQQIKERYDFDREMYVIERILVPLFEMYAVVEKLNLSTQTTAYKVVRLCVKRGDSWQLCPLKVRARIRELRRGIVREEGWPRFRDELRKVRSRRASTSNPSWLISGKDYLLPLIHGALRTRAHFKDPLHALRVRLARFFEPDIEPGLRDFLRRAAAESFDLRGSGAAGL